MGPLTRPCSLSRYTWSVMLKDESTADSEVVEGWEGGLRDCFTLSQMVVYREGAKRVRCDPPARGGCSWLFILDEREGRRDGWGTDRAQPRMDDDRASKGGKQTSLVKVERSIPIPMLLYRPAERVG